MIGYNCKFVTILLGHGRLPFSERTDVSMRVLALLLQKIPALPNTFT